MHVSPPFSEHRVRRCKSQRDRSDRMQRPIEQTKFEASDNDYHIIDRNLIINIIVFLVKATKCFAIVTLRQAR